MSHKDIAGLRGMNREEKYIGSLALRMEFKLKRKNEESLHSSRPGG